MTDGAPRRRLAAEERRKLIEDAATAVFGEHGFHRGSVDEIARRAGVSPPVVYDHFESKRALHLHLVELHYATLRQIWFSHMGGGEIAGQLPTAVDAWFAHVEEQPAVARMLFRDDSGDPDVLEARRRIAGDSRDALLPLVAHHLGVDADAVRIDVELAWEALRAVLQGLALWWLEHPDVPRERVVAAALNAVWTGYERVLAPVTSE